MVIKNMRSMTNQTMYRPNLLENLKKRIYNKYSNFEENSQLDQASFFLKRVMDKLFIDYSTPKKLASIINIIEETNSSDLALILSQIYDNNKQVFLYVGNITAKEAMSQSKQLNQLLIKGDNVAFS